MKRTLLLALLCATSVSAQAQDAPSFVNEAMINASPAQLWRIWSTSEGYKLLGVAQAQVDLRIGGLIVSRYGADGVLGDEGSILNRILAFEPQRMVAIRIERAPKSFPFKKAWTQTWTVITFTQVAPGRTLLRVASMGFGSDEESVAMRRFFEAGNAATLEHLQKQFQSAAAR